MNVIKSIRKELAVSQAELGAGIGVSQGNVSFYEKGQTVPPEVARRLIAYAKTKGLTLTFDEIYAEDRPDPNPADSAAAEA